MPCISQARVRSGVTARPLETSAVALLLAAPAGTRGHGLPALQGAADRAQLVIFRAQPFKAQPIKQRAELMLRSRRTYVKIYTRGVAPPDKNESLIQARTASWRVGAESPPGAPGPEERGEAQEN